MKSTIFTAPISHLKAFNNLFIELTEKTATRGVSIATSIFRYLKKLKTLSQ